ncbi:hypothetical protein SERLA73DRAFT_185277, partial [Serpula lacrymans var. lacrymans S7.3]
MQETSQCEHSIILTQHDFRLCSGRDIRTRLQLPEAPNGDESKKQNYAMRSARTLSDSELRRHPEQQWGSKMEILSVRPCAESEYSHRAVRALRIALTSNRLPVDGPVTLSEGTLRQ